MIRSLTTLRMVLAASLVAFLPSNAALAQSGPPDLMKLTIEDLMNIEVTSASRKEQRAKDAAAAIFVITRDDIRRSGMTTVPDVLRLAPGVDVAQINSNKWSVSIRGFNGLFANKLLVLVDGRSVYSHLFSGVIWDAEDLMLDDVERIEVIRGPGAALWGANAVNGVINIMTKTAADTQGGLVRVEAGRSGEQGAVRYGGTAGAARYRLFSQWTGRTESLIAPGTGANDASRSVTGGFRADWSTSPDGFTLDGAFTTSRARALWSNLNPQTAARNPIVDEPSDADGGHLMGRWTRTRPGGASLQVQSFVDIAHRNETIGDYQRGTVDVDAQYHTPLGAHHDLVAGAGFRFLREKFNGHVGLSLTPAEDTSSLSTVFVQDEIALFSNRLAVTLGSQAQYDSSAGAAVQPTARVMWKGLPRQHMWAAVSRALRTPSLQDRGIRATLPPTPTASGLPLFVVTQGNPAAQTETFVDLEAGYRIDIGSSAWIGATGFTGRYGQLQTQEIGAPIVEFVPSPRITVTGQFGNLLAATTRGLEVDGHWAPTSAWHFDGSYAAFRLTPDLAAASHDPTAAFLDGNAPRAQWQVRAAFLPGTRATLSAAVFHVGRLEQLQVDGYMRADVSAEWRFSGRLSLMAIGQNLSDAAHAEFGIAGSLLMATQVPRSASLRLRWELR
jgi:iron complex outermembrane receptor protein